MSLDLDERQRAMLAEMGLQVFWPTSPVQEEVREPEPVSEPLVEHSVTPVPIVARLIPAPVAARPAPSSLMQPLAAAPVARSAPGAEELLGAGDPQPEWLLFVDPPSEEELREGRPMLGDAGKLLDAMLGALGLQRQQVYIACVPASRDEGTSLLLQRKVEQLRPKIILAMGRFAVQAVLQSGEPPGRLRGRAHDFAGVPVVVTYHPLVLLRTPAEKGKAWADLCLAQALMRDRA